MTEAIAFIIAAGLSFAGHEIGEWYATRGRTRDVRLIIKGFHIHHSFFGLLALVGGFLVFTNVVMFIFIGYGVGNIWQHKKTHDRVNEKGLVFITRHSENEKTF